MERSADLVINFDCYFSNRKTILIYILTRLVIIIIIALGNFFLSPKLRAIETPNGVVATQWHEKITDSFSDQTGQEILQAKLLTGYELNGNEYLGVDLKLLHGYKTYSNADNANGLPPSLITTGSINLKHAELLFPPDQEFYFLEILSRGYQTQVILPIKIERQNPKNHVELQLTLNLLVCHLVCYPVSLSFAKNYPPVKADAINPTNQTLAAAVAIAKPVAIAGQKPITYQTLAFYLGLALFGGMLLNLLPCVLPALSLKLVSLRKIPPNHHHRHEGDRHEGHEHAHHWSASEKNYYRSLQISIMVMALGLFSYFLLLGCILAIIKFFGGSMFGWGQYFQSVWFLSFALLLFLTFLWSHLGYANLAQEIFPHRLFSRLANFSLPSRKTAIVTNQPAKNHRLDDFFIGFISALLSTPCLAPYLSSAVTFAFNHSAIILLSIFMAVGLGLALPWIILALFVPKKPWLHKNLFWHNIRQKIIFFLTLLLLIAMLGWLSFLLFQHLGYYLFILLSLWLLLFNAPVIKQKFFKKYRFRFPLPQLLFIGGLVFSLFIIHINSQRATLDRQKLTTNLYDNGLLWHGFNPETEIEIKKRQTNGQASLVVVTADWCLTCQWNKQRVLATSEFKQWAIERDIYLVLADWTKKNARIKQYLISMQRYGIPLQVYYPANDLPSAPPLNPIILPEILRLSLFNNL